MGPARLSPGRRVAALAAVAAAAALGALILGEYDLAGFTPYLSGTLFGLVLAEVGLTVARGGDALVSAGVAAAAGGGMVWAGWISTDHWRAPVPLGGWIGAAAAVIVGWSWVRWSARRAASNREGS